MAHKEGGGGGGPVIPIDWSAISGGPGEIEVDHIQSGRTSFCPLIAAKDSSILAHFSRPDIGLEMTPEIGNS